MNQKRKPLSTFLRTVTAAAMLAAAMTPVAGQMAHAGKEGVFVSDTIYFTLDDVTFSPAGSGQTVVFDVDLTNGSDSAFNMNGYGLRLYASDGSTYSARLAQKASALVQAGQSSTYRYVADIPAGLTAEQLKVDIFAWNFSQAPYLNEIGKLSIPQEDIKPAGSAQVLLNLNDADPAQDSDSLVSFELLRSEKALQNGSWYEYAELAMENRGSSSVKLPAALGFEMRDAGGNTYASSAVSGADQELPPHGRALVTVQLPLGDGDAGGDGLSLELVRKAGSDQPDAAVLGTLSLAPSAAGTPSSAPYPSITGSKLQLSGDHFSVSGKGSSPSPNSSGSPGTQVTGIVTLSNSGTDAVAVPALSASYQLKDSVLSAAAEDREAGTHPVYLAAGESTTYAFTADLPAGTDPSLFQLVVWDKSNPALLIPVRVSAVAAASAAAPGSDIYTTIGRLSLTRTSTYRLPTETGDDVLVSEVTVKNTDDHIISLPSAASLTGGYQLGSYDAAGKVAYLQSSNLLNPGQAATLYVYTRIPLDTPVRNGQVYIGAAASPAGEASKDIWAELAFDDPTTEINPIEAGQEWLSADPAKPSSGKIVESQVYDLGTQKLLAVRILQSSLATRGGTATAYTGYAADKTDSIWSLKSDEDTATKLGKGGQELTTLWSVIPSSAAPTDWRFVFGTKLDDGVIAKPQSYDFAASANSSPAYGSALNQLALFPYSLSLSNGKLVYGGAGTYDISFDYTQTVQGDIAGAAAGRSLQLVLQDNAGNDVKSWEYPLEGTLNGSAPLSSGATNKLSLPAAAITDLAGLITGPKLAVYEKFESGTRLVGTLTLSLH